ncbi:MAG: penicillin-binding protein 2 [Chromatiales bacterium]|jgi:cell division protein FtsI (penicillin-binding protein 3)
MIRGLFPRRGRAADGGAAEPPSATPEWKRDLERRSHLETSRNRLLLAGALFTAAFVAVGVRMVDLSGPQPVEERTLAAVDAGRVYTGRAEIVDRTGTVLATTLKTASLYADARRVRNPDEVARKLVAVLPELDYDTARKRLASGRSFVWLHRNLTPREQYEVNALGEPGLDFQQEEQRVYPQGPLAAHVLGFVDIDGRGIAGIERTFDGRLRGEHEQLQLSLDLRVQNILREELARAMTTYSAIGATGIVLDANTGEVVALASLPDFDPNHPAEAPSETRFNRATMGVYELGSTFKLLTAAAALDAGTVNITGGYDASNPIHVARFTINDFHAKKRWLSVPEILIYSSNIGAAKMALDLGVERHKAFIERIGMTRPANLELPETADPLVPSGKWRELTSMTIAYGHGIAVTPLHLANAVAAIANGGFLRQATLVRRAEDGPMPAHQVISLSTSEQMRKLMRLVVTHGSGRNANVPGYQVGGKTGTAEKLSPTGGYAKHKLFSSFIAAFPMDKPRYVVFAALDEPKGTEETHGYATAGWVTAPAVGTVISRIAPILGVAPDPVELRQAKEAANGGRTLASF